MWNFFSDILDWTVGHHGALLLDLGLTALFAYPLYHYMVYGWNRKWEELEDTLNVFAKQAYMASFRNLNYQLSEVDDKFAKLYRESYGRRWFIIPIGLAVVTACIGNYLVAADLIPLAASSGADVKFNIAPAAVAGAYTFVTYDFYRRVQRRNLLTVDIVRNALRLAIAIPVGYAFATLNLHIGAFIAFAVGAFPLGDLLAILRRVANERLKLHIGPAPVGSRSVQLLGIDPETADRIEDADITTIPQLSTCDPVDLAMRTNLQFRYVVNMCSQALAWIYLRDKLDTLRPLGLSTALEIRELMYDFEEPARATRAQRVLSVAATAAKVPIDGLRHAFRQIISAPNTRFLYDALSGSPTVGARAPARARRRPARRSRRRARR